MKSRNIVVGDINSCKIIISAHYDTCANLFVPNICFPFSIYLYIIYQIFLTIVMLLICGIVYLGLNMFLGINYNVILFCILFIFLVVIMIFFGISNKNNYNDNTSGVVCLIEMINKLDNLNDVAFIFFDNEEKGLLGSGQFIKNSKINFNEKILINLDCVSDGDNILILPSKKITQEFYDKIMNAFKNDKKNIIGSKDKLFLYPSDQIYFPVNIGICSCNKNRFGYYLDKIHTNKDIVFDLKNIELITNSLLKIIK